MSRIGRKTIQIPTGVTVTVDGNNVKVKGPKGELEMVKRPEVDVALEDTSLNCTLNTENKDTSALWGLTRALIANMITGVTDGYEKKLELVGVGYRAKEEGSNKISLSVGYSNPVVIEAPEGIQLAVEDQKVVYIRGIDKQLVGLTAANIRKVRKPEPYKGKGIKYFDEVILRKAGKTGK